jgi:4'-phosphopantetheinyl transferase
MGKEGVAALSQPLGSALGVDLWLVPVDSVGDRPDLDILSAAERARAARFAFDRDRQRYVASCIALRQLLATRVGTAAAEIQFVQSEHGKPRLSGHGPSFSLSRSGRFVLMGVGTGQIGVDIEGLEPIPRPGRLAEELCTQAECADIRRVAHTEQALLRCWTRKEACLKALGCGLSVHPATFDVGVTTEERIVPIVIQGRRVFVAVTSTPTAVHYVGAVAKVL